MRRPALQPLFDPAAARESRERTVPRAAQSLCGGLGTQSLEVMQHDRRAELLGQPVDLGDQGAIVGLGTERDISPDFEGGPLGFGGSRRCAAPRAPST